MLLGLVWSIFGLMILGMGALAVWATYGGDMRPTKPGDMPEWWMYGVGAALAFGGFALISGGLGRMVSAFARECYFMAGPDGIAIRVPKQGWFGRFRVMEYRVRWNEISQIVRFVQRVNLIPVSSELQIHLETGNRIGIARHYFRDGVKAIQQKLAAIAATFGR
ncbi:MAG: hypothetical protein ABSF23_07135 [Terracidiphilus sp.]